MVWRSAIGIYFERSRCVVLIDEPCGLSFSTVFLLVMWAIHHDTLRFAWICAQRMPRAILSIQYSTVPSPFPNTVPLRKVSAREATGRPSRKTRIFLHMTAPRTLSIKAQRPERKEFE